MWALSFISKLCLIPELNLSICKAIAPGHSVSSPNPVFQLWFHFTDLHVITSLACDDVACAALLSFDLMLRCGQLELLRCVDVAFSTCYVWCPHHKSLRFPYLRQPTADVWQRLVHLQQVGPEMSYFSSAPHRSTASCSAPSVKRSCMYALLGTPLGVVGLRRELTRGSLQTPSGDLSGGPPSEQ